MTNMPTMKNFTFTDGEVSFLAEQCEQKNGRIVELDRQLQDAQAIINKLETEAHELRQRMKAMQLHMTSLAAQNQALELRIAAWRLKFGEE